MSTNLQAGDARYYLGDKEMGASQQFGDTTTAADTYAAGNSYGVAFQSQISNLNPGNGLNTLTQSQPIMEVREAVDLAQDFYLTLRSFHYERTKDMNPSPLNILETWKII